MANPLTSSRFEKQHSSRMFLANILLAFISGLYILIQAKSVPTALTANIAHCKGVRVNTRRAVSKAEEFRRMVAQIAYKTWTKLPYQHQIWLSVDDLIEDGMFRAYQVAVGTWYDKSKASLCTSIYHAVRNHLHNEYIVRYGNEMRFASLEGAGIMDKRKRTRRGYTPAGMVSIDELKSMDDDRVVELPQLSTSEETIYSNVLTDCFVVPVLGKIYKEASSKLQDQMIIWLFQNKEKVHLKGTKFRRAAKEFRLLAEEHDLTYFDCEHLIRSPRCMNSLSHEILCVPYDLERPAPAMDREL